MITTMMFGNCIKVVFICVLTVTFVGNLFVGLGKLPTLSSSSCACEEIIQSQPSTVVQEVASIGISVSSDSTTTPETTAIALLQNQTTPPQQEQSTALAPPPQQQQHWPAIVHPHIDYVAFIREDKAKVTNVVLLQGSGLCSQMMNLMAQKIFYQVDRSRGFIVEELQYGYKWSDDMGVLTGFFTPQFPVLRKGDWESVFEKHFAMPSMKKIIGAGPKVHVEKHNIIVQRAIRPDFRLSFPKAYGTSGIPLYHRFVSEACANLQFNARAKAEMDALRIQQGIPNLRDTLSVAFHVRRGDKITMKESKAYPGALYVEHMLHATKHEHKPIQHCFVATDDYRAVGEITTALQRKNVTCQVHTLTTKSELANDGNQKAAYTERQSTVEFLTEVSLLIDATYFVGTFNSNVGAFTALLRKCYYVGAPHFAHSYGVDQKHWYYRP